MEIRIPEVGESVVEALVAKWHRKDGETVRREDPVCELETDKVTLEINAEVDGILSILIPEGVTVKIGSVIGEIRETIQPEDRSRMEAKPDQAVPPLSPAARKLAREKAIQPETIKGSGKKGRVLMEDLFAPHSTVEPPSDMEEETPQPESPGIIIEDMFPLPLEEEPLDTTQWEPPPTEDSAFTTAEQKDRIIHQLLDRKEEPVLPEAEPARRSTRKPMTPIRRRIAERLTDARRQTAMVTTYNEVDMGRVIALRRKHQENFRMRHGVSLGYMSFFVKAVVEALKEFPEVNARIDGDDIVYQHFYDIGIAVSGEKGLVAPVLRDADRMHSAEIEQAIDGFVEKILTHRLEPSELEGGTFTISNGGVFGSLLSTPIINPPQSAILGMHVIQDRPVALIGKVVIRPMMYLALSYDHRIIDGREAVRFLKKIKEYLEEPEEMMLEE